MKKRLEYKTYLQSPEWRVVRKKQLRNQRDCQACGSKEHLNIHHMTYHRLGFEKLKNLKTLCKTCHRQLHMEFKLWREKNGFKRDDLIVFTRRFCKKIRRNKLK